MRQIVSYLLFIGLVCRIDSAYADSTKGAVEPERLRVAFINPGYGDRGFWKDVRDTMEAAADQFGFELVVFDSDRNWEKMAESARKAFAMQPPPDYIIAVNEYQQGTRIVLEAEERGIPYIMLLNDLTEFQKETYGMPRKGLANWLFTLTPDNERAGYEIAASLIDAARFEFEDNMPKSLCLLSIAGDRSTPASLQRLEGLDHALARFPVLKEQRRLVANWSFGEAFRQTTAWLERGACVDAVWAANDAIALGAIAALENAGRVPGKDVFVGGLNWSEEGVGAVADGKMTMTHGGHFLAGAWAMVLLHDYTQGVEIPKDSIELSFRMEAITRENVARFDKILGARDWKNIDFSRFSLANPASRGEYRFGLQSYVDDQGG